MGSQPGYCKACRQHGKRIHYLDRYPGTNVLTRGEHARNEKEQYECTGICEDCEQQTMVSREELLRASSLWGKQAVHDMILINEYLNSLEDGEYNAESLISGAPLGLQLSEDRRASLEGLVLAAVRVRMSDGSPKDMREAARTVFIPHYESWGHEDKIRKEFSERWRFF
jgi:hypothetical protein